MFRSLKIIAIFLLPVVVAYVFYGCTGRKGHSPDEKAVLARINDYELTVKDFKDEAELLSPTKYFSGSMDSAKAILLDEMIGKKMLVMEAQRENFDKEESFMKEIERYWEQALLKRLMKKKMKEFSRTITVSDSEAKEEYDRLLKENNGRMESFEKMSPEIRSDLLHRKMQEAFDGWVEELKKKTKVEIDRDKLKKLSLE